MVEEPLLLRNSCQDPRDSEIYLPQECEEFGYVIKGTVKLCYGGKVHTVKAGESFYFKAGKKHFIENKSSKDAVLIWVSNPPSF